MWDIDLFDLFRVLLTIFVTIYVTTVTVYIAWGWISWLAGSDRYTSLLRRYLVLMVLRMRVRTFWADALVLVLICVAIGLIWYAHWIIDDIGRIVSGAT